MNSVVIFVFFFAFAFALVSGFPTVDDFQHHQLQIKVKEEEEVKDFDLPEVHDDDGGERFRRATCDLLSVSLPWGSLNHSACAAHCLAMRKGYRGGRCRDGVCHCRR